MRWWKWLGVAGLAGVAATGVVVARGERQRRSYSPDDVRARLHERAAVIEDTAAASSHPVAPATDLSETGPAPRKSLRARVFRR